MSWLFMQLWFLMVLAFVAGALVAYVVCSQVVPHVDRLEAGPQREGSH